MATHAPITGAPSRAPVIYDTIALFCEKQGMALSRFGREVAGDPGLVYAIRDGRAVRPATLAKINAYLAGHRTHVRRVPSGRRKRQADDFATIARRHRTMMQEGSAQLLAAILREAGRA